MVPKVSRSLLCAVLLLAGWEVRALAEEPPALHFSISEGQQQLRFDPFPAAEAYQILRADSLDKPFVEDNSGALSGFTWTAPLRADSLGFYTVRPVSVSNNDLLSAIVLNRIAYGQTPDELERVKAMGPDAYIQEQLAPEKVEEQLEIDVPPKSGESDWQYITGTGTGSSSVFYVYLNAVGEGFIDDITLVEGTVAESGSNLLRNGGFESPLINADWTISENHAGSALSTEIKHTGNSSLHLVASSPGTTQASSVWQTIRPALSENKQYTLSYWFLPGGTKRASVTVRLSGSGIIGGSLFGRLVNNEATIDNLRAWHILHAIQSKRQLLEVLLQFLENHFVTEYTKSGDWFDKFYDNDDPQRLRYAVNLEFREIQRWRQALLNPKCTFYDLLKISAESPAMIIYLDTVTSAGQGNSIANENYARELLELFTFGVDNGYDQTDIVETSKTWAGWRVAMQNPENEFSPHTVPLFHPSNEPEKATNYNGVWSLWYRPDRHNNNAKTIFQGKTVPARFGPPNGGRSYELTIPARSGTVGIQDGYDVIRHLADQPFTQEFISVKLCRLFIHDDFVHGVYDYTDANLSPESKLIKQCMGAWENGDPKGQIRSVLAVIFNSELFRSNAAAAQKVRTPLEFTVSAVRALRASVNGAFTAETDGNLTAPLDRMGSMRLFDRAEPDGYPESGPPWISAGTLAERLRWVQGLLVARGTANRPAEVNANTYCDPATLLKSKLTQANWQNAESVADYFVSLLYPGEGRANLDLYRKLAVDFLNTADNGVTASPLTSLSNAGSPSPYDLRIRGAVAMLMTLQRFQEQ